MDIFRSFTVTTAGLVGTPLASVSGAAHGSSQAGNATSRMPDILTEKSGQRDSLLEMLNVLFNNPEAIDQNFLETCIPELQEGLINTDNSVAISAKNALEGLCSAALHLLQSPIDSLIAASKAAEGLFELQIPCQLVSDAIHNAFKFNAEKKAGSASLDSVSAKLDEHADRVSANIRQAIDIPQNPHAAFHAGLADGSTGGACIGTTGLPPTATALLIDIIGQLSREASALQHACAKESASNDNEQNIYLASTQVMKASQQSDCQLLQDASQDVELALSNTDPASDLLAVQSVTTPLTTALLRLIILGFFSGTAQTVNNIALAVSEGRMQKALAKATADAPSGGVDRIESSHSNLCSLSNIMRLCAENLDGSALIETGVRLSESVSGRALSVMLSHAAELAQLLSQLIAPGEGVNAELNPQINLDSSVEFARENAQARSEQIIKNALDRIEGAYNQPVIPKLNADMASQMRTFTKLGVPSLITMHSLFVNPPKIATDGSREASETYDAQRNAALMATLPELTILLNQIQAFTVNYKQEMQPHCNSFNEKESLLSLHGSAESHTILIYRSVSSITLIADEMLSICRSLTLIDKQRLQNATEKLGEIQSNEAFDQSTEQVAWDSHLEQEYSTTHAVSALRLTLSHLGIALINIASELHKALKNNLDTVKENVAMHDLQKSLLHTTATASLHIAESLLVATGGASASVMSLRGTADSSQKIVHSTYGKLHPKQTHCSENSLKEITPSFQASGFGVDLVGGTISNFLKVLSQGGVIGLGSLLKLVQALEVMSLHRDSLTELMLDADRETHPNGFYKNATAKPSADTKVGSIALINNFLGMLASLDESSATDHVLSTQNRLQQILDDEIASLGILDDEQENPSHNKIGLREFYKIIARLMLPNCQDQDAPINELITQLNFGGIFLSSYHTRFNNAPPTRFTEFFANADDAQGILCQFIDKAKKDNCLFLSLHNAMPEADRSDKVALLYEHISETLYQHFKQTTLSDFATYGAKRRTPTLEEFLEEMGIIEANEEENLTPRGQGF